MRKHRLYRNTHNKDKYFWSLSCVPNGYLTQDRRHLLLLEPYTQDGDNSQVEFVENQDDELGVVKSTTWTVRYSFALSWVRDLPGEIDAEMNACTGYSGNPMYPFGDYRSAKWYTDNYQPLDGDDEKYDEDQLIEVANDRFHDWEDDVDIVRKVYRHLGLKLRDLDVDYDHFRCR